MRKSRVGITALALVMAALWGVVETRAQQAQQGGRKQGQGGGGQGDERRRQGNPRTFPAPKSADPQADFILGRASDTGIAITVHPKLDILGPLVIVGPNSQPVFSYPKFSDARAEGFAFKNGVPTEIEVKGLTPATRYQFGFIKRGPDGSEVPEFKGEFRTAPVPGSTFSFFVQGDSHPERNPKMCVPELYERTLNLAASQKPDFFICLGDDFSVDTLRERNKTTVEGVYKQQVPYLGLVGKVAPLFLVNGNHEQAAKANLNGTPDSVAVWAQNARNRYFPQPAPDAFYSGNSEKVENIGLLRNYFAFSWGDALIAVIDPYWHSAVTVDNGLEGKERNRDLWKVTLGDAQYKWLKNSLEKSKAKYKFVFAHHVHGTGRGGVEQAPYYEWGGKDRNGADRFKEYRPNWEMPIHELFKKTGVQVFFQVHDHIFCKQELDGVIYQSCPTPGDASNPLYNADAYRSGEKVSGAGLVKVTVSPENAKIEFLRAYLPGQEVDGKKHGEVAHSYTVKAGGK